MEAAANFFLDNQDAIFVIILAVFLGTEVIKNVPALLHTPLMSGSNAVSGVVIMGSLIILGHADSEDLLTLVLGFLAVFLGMLNVVGGFVVTGRMLAMFRKKK
ncbi:MAG: transhydrogenase subunit alpha [Bacteroidota bacterium]|jgi:NAD(P) transhydrogenase subunit alpha